MQNRKLGKGLTMLSGLWYILTGMLLFSYSCNLRAILVLVEYEKPIETMKEITEQVKKQNHHQTCEFDIKYLFHQDIPTYYPKGSAVENILRFANDEYFQKIYARGIDQETGVLYNRGTLPQPKLEHMIENRGCQATANYFNGIASLKNHRIPLHKVNEYISLLFHSFCWARKNNSPFLPDFNKVIGGIREGGIFLKGLSDNYRYFSGDIKASVAASNLTLAHVTTAFMLLGTGLFLSGCAFLFEMTSSRRKD